MIDNLMNGLSSESEPDLSDEIEILWLLII